MRVPSPVFRLLACATALLVSGAVRAAAAPRIGHAVIAAMSGEAEYVYPEETAHEYPTGRSDLYEGLALTEEQSIETGKDGHVCAVLTPGAVVCIAPRTSLRLEKLRQRTEGLPESEKDLMRTIELGLDEGGLLMHGGVPSPSLDIRVTTPLGVVEANGGDFLVEGSGDRFQIVVEAGDLSFRTGEKVEGATEGQSLTAQRDASGRVSVTRAAGPVGDTVPNFDVCRTFFPDMEEFVFLVEQLDWDGLADWIGLSDSIVAVGDPTAWRDVSPSFRVETPDASRGAPRIAGGPGGQRARRWDMWAWYRAVGVIRGVNYIPRTAVNTTEMWQEETFDPDTIDEELEWAHDVGYNSLRVHLQYLVWKSDPDGFKDRMKEFLDIAEKHAMSTVFVLFDDSRDSGKDPFLGSQPPPKPGVHNSGWTPSPGHALVVDRAARGDLEAYVRDIVGTFKRDRRVLFWDLYHTAGNAGLWDRSLPLAEAAFAWARDVDPKQPLTTAPWRDLGSAMSARLMELSDVITVQTFDDAAGVRARLVAAKRFARPVICTDWLKRQAGSTFEEVLPIFAENGVGWYSRGLVRGRSQQYIPEDHKNPKQEPALWQHDVLHEDGKPYDKEEISRIRAFRFAE